MKTALTRLCGTEQEIERAMSGQAHQRQHWPASTAAELNAPTQTELPIADQRKFVLLISSTSLFSNSKKSVVQVSTFAEFELAVRQAVQITDANLQIDILVYDEDFGEWVCTTTLDCVSIE